MDNGIKLIEQEVKQEMTHGDSGHDWSHIERVRNIALTIAQQEVQSGRQVNLAVVELGALLHDIADHKFYGGDEEIGPKKAAEMMKPHFEQTIIDQVVYIIRNISFKGANVQNTMNTIEGLIVQDADRIDALGAIGIARCFSYGGFRQRVMYDPNIPPQLHNSAEEYKKAQGTTINHFYEKLFLLKDKMNTEAGRRIAEERHNYMVAFVDQFLAEWNGKK